MGRPKEFDKDQALDAAIGVFREHGFEGASAGMLTQAMKIGRQSLYDTFGDKWQLYCAAVERYGAREIQAHIAALRGAPKAVDGIRRMLERVADEASLPCLGVGSISEFGESRADLSGIRDAAGRVLQENLAARVRAAQAEGDLAPGLDPRQAAAYLVANIGALRLAARGGAGPDELRGLVAFTMRALG